MGRTRDGRNPYERVHEPCVRVFAPHFWGTEQEAPKSTAIVRDLQEVLHEALEGVKLTEGRIPKRGIFARALAVVDPRAQVVRSVSLSDVPAIGHEYGHLMQKLLLGSSKEGGIDNATLATLPGAVRGELQDLAKGISNESLTEGWAEFWALSPVQLAVVLTRPRPTVPDGRRLLQRAGMRPLI